MAADSSGSGPTRHGGAGGFALSRLKRGWGRSKPDDREADDAARALRFVHCVEDQGSGLMNPLISDDPKGPLEQLMVTNELFEL